jgi:CRISPR-associated protein Csm5
MSELKKLYRAEVEILSPLHIGTGKALQRGFDYTVYQNRTWRINEDTLFKEVYDRSQGDRQALNRLLTGRPAEELLLPEDYRSHPEFFRYQMPGQPRAEGRGAELRECLKNAYDKPYLPGSTFKGALRTALAWAIFRAERRRFDARKLGYNRSWAAQPLERELFGRDPNHDLLRALQVGDSEPVDKDALMLANVQVVAGTRLQSPIEVEALKPGTTLRLTLIFDEYLLSPATAGRLGWGQKGEHLRQLAVHSRNLALVRIKAQKAHFASWPELSRVQRFYELLEQLHGKLKEGSDFLLQVGWGGGWDAKTLDGQISDDPQQFEQVISDFRLSRSRNRRVGDPFPRSRRLYFQDNRPTMPLGWVKVTLR